jgi:uncharacterized protein
MTGLALFGFAVALMIRSNLGLGPWDAFHVGLHTLTGMTVGMASIVVGVVIVAASWFIGVRPGPGTVVNMVGVGLFIDLMLPIVPNAPGLWAAFGYFAVAIVVCGFASGLYIGAGLGKGPRDGLMIGLSQRFDVRVGRLRTGCELFVLLCGWLMGGTVGIGTVIFAVTIGPAMQWGLQVFGMSATGLRPGDPVVEPVPLRRRMRRAA